MFRPALVPVAAALLLGLVALLNPGVAHAERCTDVEVGHFARAMSWASACREVSLRIGFPLVCHARPPACAASALDQALTLLHSDAEMLPELYFGRSGARCQLAISHAGRRFIGARSRERRRGVRSTARSQRPLERWIERHCALRPGDSLPRVGQTCQHVLPDDGEALDAPALARCLRSALGRILDDVSPEPLQPNVLIFYTDDQRWDTLQYMPAVTDRMQGEGIDFTSSFVTTAVCCPSRSSFFSGLYVHNTGVFGNRPPLGGAPLFDETSNVLRGLQDSGYVTALYGKYMNATDLLTSVPLGFDDWVAILTDRHLYFDYDLNDNGTIVHFGSQTEDYSTDVFRDLSLDFVDQHADRPFALITAPYAPHFANGFFDTVAAPRHRGLFAGIEPWRPANWVDAIDDKPSYLGILRGNWLRGQAMANDRFREESLDALQAVDEAVDALLDQLSELGLEDHTLVIYTSDNGYLWGEHGLTGKIAPYEPSIRVPLVVRYPLLVQKPRVEDRLALNIDLAPTLVEASGARWDRPMNGESLLPLVRDDAIDWRADFLGEGFDNPLSPFITPVPKHGYVRTEEWKYVLYDADQYQELYDLVIDPLERDNLALDPANAPVLQEFRVRLEELLLE